MENARRIDKPSAAPRVRTKRGSAGKGSAEPLASASSVITDDADRGPVVGANLRSLRANRGLSLEGLARLSGVSRAMLGQIELGQSTPTINVLWKIARALNVPFSALLSQPQKSRVRVLRKESSKVLVSHGGAFSSRALFPFDAPHRVELYELRLAGGGVEEAEAHPPGTIENLVVAAGAMEIVVDGESHALSTGDAILFHADVTHEYRNPGTREVVAYLVMTYAERVG